MNRTEKEASIETMVEIFKSTQMGLLVDYRGLNVADVTELRAELHNNNTSMKVLQNRLAKIAIEGTPFEPLKDNLVETRAFIFGDDPVAPAKVVSKFMTTNDKLQFISGVLVTGTESDVLDLSKIKYLGGLPSRDELLAKLMGLMTAVPTKFVRTLNEVPSKFVRTLAALRDSKEAA